MKFSKISFVQLWLLRHFVNIDVNSRWPIKGDTRWLKIARKLKIIERKLENIYNILLWKYETSIVLKSQPYSNYATND